MLAGCAGRSSSVVPGDGAKPAGHGRTTATFTIRVPKPTAAQAARRAPRYISPATESLTLLVTNHVGGATVLNETAGLTPTAQGCTSTLTSTICTLNLALSPGQYDASIATYDGYDSVHNAVSGNQLSAGQLIDFTISAGVANTVSVTLSGIPASIVVTGTSSKVRGTQAAGFTTLGRNARSMLVFALDADGDIIVGPGSPAFTVGVTSGSGFTVTNPTTTAPNTFSIKPQGAAGQTTSFTATAAYTDSTCSLPGAVCTTTFSATDSAQTLFVSNRDQNSVTVYNAPYGTPSATVTANLTSPFGITTDAAGDLFATNNSTADVYEFAPPYTGTPNAISTGIYTPSDVLIAPNGTLFAAGGAYLTESAPPYSSSSQISTLMAGAKGMALDASGNLFVANQNSNSVQVFAPPYTGAPTSITNGVSEPQDVLLDPSGNLFVANFGSTCCGFVTIYAPPSYTLTTTITNSIFEPSWIVMDVSRNLFVANNGGGVLIYAPPYTGSPVTVATGLSPDSLALDIDQNLFVADFGTNDVEEFAPPYTGAPIATITTGVNGPTSITLSQ